MSPVASAQTDTQTDTQSVSGFQDFFLQPIIKDRPNIQTHIPVRLTKLRGFPKTSAATTWFMAGNWLDAHTSIPSSDGTA